MENWKKKISYFPIENKLVRQNFYIHKLQQMASEKCKGKWKMKMRKKF